MLKYKVGKYSSQDSMSELICDNYPMLLVMSRFGIDLGFGEQTIEECCRESGVDVSTFLAVVNILISNRKREVKIDYDKISLGALIEYLHNSHSYFLDYRLPQIRAKLIEVMGGKSDLTVAIVNYYDEYLNEVRRHMMSEEERLFPYIAKVLAKESTEGYNIEEYSRHHDKVESKLTEFKNIIIKYCPSKSTNELNSVLYDIFSCERDLASHSDIEDFLLVPTMKHLESLK